MNDVTVTETILAARGKYGSPVQILVSTFSHGTLVASAEIDHLNEYQFVRAVQEAFPEYEVVGQGRVDEFWYAKGGKVK